MRKLPADDLVPIIGPPQRIIGAYRDRGDEDVAGLLVEAKDDLNEPASSSTASAAEINEILDLL